MTNLNSVLNEMESAALVDSTLSFLNEYVLDSAVVFDSLRLVIQSLHNSGNTARRRLQTSSSTTTLATTYIALGTCPSSVDLSDVAASVLNENDTKYIMNLQADPILGASVFAGESIGLELVEEPSAVPSSYPSVSVEPSATPSDIPSLLSSIVPSSVSSGVESLIPTMISSTASSGQPSMVSSIVSGSPILVDSGVPSVSLTYAPAISSPSYTSSPVIIDPSTTTSTPTSTDVPTTIDQTVISPPSANSDSPTAIGDEPGDGDISPTADNFSFQETTILQIIAIGTPSRLMNSTEEIQFSKVCMEHLSNNINDSTINVTGVKIVGQRLLSSGSSFKKSRVLVNNNDDSLYITTQIIAVCLEASAPLYTISKDIFESTADVFMVSLKEDNILGSVYDSFFSNVGDVVLGEVPSQSPSDSPTVEFSSKPSEQATEGISQSTAAAVGAAAAAGSAAAAAAAGGGGGGGGEGGDSGGDGGNASKEGTNKVDKNTSAEEEARKQMSGRNMKKTTGRLAAEGKKNYNRIKMRQRDGQLAGREASFREDCRREFRIRVNMLIALQHFDKNLDHFEDANRTRWQLLSPEVKEMLEMAADQLATAAV